MAYTWGHFQVPGKGLKISNLTSHPHLPGANELNEFENYDFEIAAIFPSANESRAQELIKWNVSHFVIIRGHYSDVIMGGRDSISDHQPHDCLLKCLFRRRSKKTSKLASLAFVQGIHRGPVNSPHKWPVTRKMFPFDDVIMVYWWLGIIRFGHSYDISRLRIFELWIKFHQCSFLKVKLMDGLVPTR